MAKKAFVYDGTNWVDIAQSTADLTNYANMTTTPISGFRNAIINGKFDVWQRGTSSTSTSANYFTADRWAQWINSGTGTVAQETSLVPTGFRYGLKYTSSGASGACNFYHTIETANAIGMAGKSVTLSMWLAGTAAKTAEVLFLSSTTTDAAFTSSFTQIGSTVTVTLSGTPTRMQQAFTVPSDAKTLQVIVRCSGYANTNFFTFTGVQLEQGSIATPFEQRPIGTELALCQRYYQIIPFFGIAVNTGEMGASGIFKVTMRTTPSMGTALNNGLTGGGGNSLTRLGVGSAGVGSATAGQISNNAITAIYCSGLTSGAVYSGSIDVSAEL